MSEKRDTYLCGEDMNLQEFLPKHYEYFFEERKLLRILFIFVFLISIGGIAWL